VALESREAPQWALPAWGLAGASFAAAAAHVLVSTPPAPATEYVDLRVADRIEPATASASSRSAARGDRPFALGTETAGAEPWNDGFVASLASLEGDQPSRAPTREGAGNLLAAASFDGEQFSASGLPSPEQAPGESSFAALPGEAESGGGGDSPNLVGKSPPDASSALSAPAPGQAATNNPATPTSPTAAPASAISSGTQTAALAHGLANPKLIQPSASPSPAPLPASGPLGPGGPSASSPGILAVGPDAGHAPTVKVYDPTTLKLKFTSRPANHTFPGRSHLPGRWRGGGST
jgi:hypothetical protein